MAGFQRAAGAGSIEFQRRGLRGGGKASGGQGRGKGGCAARPKQAAAVNARH
jgi:hypothetical protein